MDLKIEELESIVAPDAWDNAEHFAEGFLAGAGFVLAVAAIAT
jgi:hypothetical protein